VEISESRPTQTSVDCWTFYESRTAGGCNFDLSIFRDGDLPRSGLSDGLLCCEKDRGGPRGTSTIQAAVFALLGLLLGFTFANGISHLDQRRVLIVQESNAIGTAYLRLDLLPANQQQEMRQLFRQYLDTRLDV
jgi:hypothetical protein